MSPTQLVDYATQYLIVNLTILLNSHKYLLYLLNILFLFFHLKQNYVFLSLRDAALVIKTKKNVTRPGHLVYVCNIILTQVSLFYP